MASPRRRVLPGFGLSLGFTLTYVCLLVLLPLTGADGEAGDEGQASADASAAHATDSRGGNLYEAVGAEHGLALGDDRGGRLAGRGRTGGSPRAAGAFLASAVACRCWARR